MLKLIEKSRRFIYIENQFFVSDFGKEVRPRTLSPAAQFINQYRGKSQNSSAALVAASSAEAGWKMPGPGSWSVRNRAAAIHPPTNRIVGALLARIKQSALSGSPFHVYITLPVHPEGCLCDAVVAVQVYWTMQTISFGTFSLLNGIRRIIKARELLKAKARDFERVFAEDNNEYEAIPLEACNEFVTLLNLRNWAKLGDRYVTEQIYVHSKVMIVDDLYALIGSANINDRSLLGERDSELAVLVMDGEAVRANVNGDGSNSIVRKFAHELRVNLWKKIFGIAGNERAAVELKQSIEQPGNPQSWKTLQRRSATNGELFEAAFGWIPRNRSINSKGRSEPARILPTWDSNEAAPPASTWGDKGNLGYPAPFQEVFWDKKTFSTNAGPALNSIRGFITSLPIEWIRNENVRFEYPAALVADGNQCQSSEPQV